MNRKRKSSIEETVELWAKEQLKGIKLYPKTDFINPQIEKALKTEPSKKGTLNENLALYFLAPIRKKGKGYAYSFKWTKEKM